MIYLKAKFKQVKEMKSGNKLIFWSNEVPDELDRLQYTGDEGHLVFHVDELKKGVIEAIQDKAPGVIDDKKQTSSQRLRGIIFQVFIKKYPQHSGLSTEESKKAWASAYAKAMEVHIDDWKKKL